MNILKRNSTTINVATFWENYQLGKYNFDPPYQRPSDVWNETKQSFLIDTILKNFPMPPIFLHQHIDPQSGKTMYDVIDGKQRLTAIINFLKNSIPTPDDFNGDSFGDDNLVGIYFKDLEKPGISEWKKVLWRYEITIEYIDTDQQNIVTNIFDRLNRNGEPLTRQELRNAKYHTSPLYELIKRLSALEAFSEIFEKIQINRFEDHEIVSELLFAQLEGEVLSGDNNLIDVLYAKYANALQDIPGIEAKFKNVTNVFSSFAIDYAKHKLQGLSHFYALWFLALTIYNNDQSVDGKRFAGSLDEFYTKFKQGDKLTPELTDYKVSMTSNTKSKSSRIKRINSLIKYCGIEIPPVGIQ